MSGGGDTSICIALQDEPMWSEFNAQTTEMIVARPGRQLFPKLAIKLYGLDPYTIYGIRIRLRRADQFKYRYSVEKWNQIGESDEEEAPCGNVAYNLNGFMQSGYEWMRRAADFSHFKITNDKAMYKDHMVFVQSQHKYIPCVEITDERGNVIRWQYFPIASFITVTTYHNPAIKELKVKHNGFAKNHQKSFEYTPYHHYASKAQPAWTQQNWDASAISRKRPSAYPNDSPPTKMAAYDPSSFDQWIQSYGYGDNVLAVPTVPEGVTNSAEAYFAPKIDPNAISLHTDIPSFTLLVKNEGAWDGQDKKTPAQETSTIEAGSSRLLNGPTDAVWNVKLENTRDDFPSSHSFPENLWDIESQDSHENLDPLLDHAYSYNGLRHSMSNNSELSEDEPLIDSHDLERENDFNETLNSMPDSVDGIDLIFDSFLFP